MHAAPPSLADLLETALPVSLRHVPYRLRDVAHTLDCRVALAGGVPRDLLRLSLAQLDRHGFIAELRDFDVVVEGDGVRYAYELLRRIPGQLTVNADFHTASIATSDPLRIDITTARLESYPSAGHLPLVDVSGVSIEADLARRDFTINALALDLSHDYGRVLDVHGGAGDVRDRVLRVLHGASFVDDPTRLWRALRYSLRLGYTLEPVTLAQFLAAVEDGAADNLTPERIRYELECIGAEQRWAEVWAVMDSSGLARALHPQLSGVTLDWSLEDCSALDIALGNQAQLLKREELEPWLVRTAYAVALSTAAAQPEVLARLGLFTRQQRLIEAARAVLLEDLPQLSGAPRPSFVTRLLERHPRPAVALALLIYQPRTEEGVASRKLLRRYLEEFSQVRGELDGHALIALGVPAGPALGELRDRIRYMRLDGVITDAQAERDLATELAQRLRPPPEAGNSTEEE